LKGCRGRWGTSIENEYTKLASCEKGTKSFLKGVYTPEPPPHVSAPATSTNLLKNENLTDQNSIKIEEVLLHCCWTMFVSKIDKSWNGSIGFQCDLF
jgi:hypothetical protein